MTLSFFTKWEDQTGNIWLVDRAKRTENQVFSSPALQPMLRENCVSLNAFGGLKETSVDGVRGLFVCLFVFIWGGGGACEYRIRKECVIDRIYLGRRVLPFR